MENQTQTSQEKDVQQRTTSVINQAVEISAEYNKPIHVAFIDSKKAFANV